MTSYAEGPYYGDGNIETHMFYHSHAGMNIYEASTCPRCFYGPPGNFVTDGFVPDYDSPPGNFVTEGFIPDYVPYEPKPAELLASDVRQHIRSESSSRLRDAAMGGVPLDALYFTDDCYPAWDSIYEMSSGCNHHARVQKRLLNREAAALVDPWIMKRLVDAANGKLEEARLLGIALKEMRIGEDLMPEWGRLKVDEAVDEAADEAADKTVDKTVDVAIPHNPQPVEDPPVEDEWEDSLERNMETFGADFVMANIEWTASEDNAPALDSDESFTSSDSDSSSGTDDNSHGSEQDEEPIDDRYAMLSGGDPQPLPVGYRTIAESDDEAPHILHDVEVNGGPSGTYHVDMEVYEAETDSNLDELPEVELAIDATAYEFFFPTDEALNASLPGVDLECTIEDGDVVMEA